MFIKAFGIVLPVAVGGLYVSGALSGSAYSREVERPPASVMAALEDLDITRQPGAPGTDPSASGGVMPLIRIERGPDRLTWVVMSGDRVATRMTAIVEPTDGGRHSHVTAQVERGDAPDDFVSPAFRSKGITMGLFGMAVEGELNKLVSPPVDPSKCREAVARMEQNGIIAPQDRPANLTQAMGNTAKTIVALNAQEAELRRNGCDTSGTGKFETPVSAMGEAPPPPAAGVSFEPGKPMVDVSRR
jgi:hypothetical protein